MIYVTGDTHGRSDWGKLHPQSWPLGQTLTRDDLVIICGDFGAVWSMGPRDHEEFAWHESQPWTTLWVDGNHENHDIIDTFEVSERFGGRVQEVPGYPHVIHLMRGEVYDLPVSAEESARFFVMGGAPSWDRIWRTEGTSWWAREMPSRAEYYHATASLDRADWSVDYVLSHEVPYSAMAEALGGAYLTTHKSPPHNELSDFLQHVDEKLDKDRLRMWYAGHYHVDRMAMDDRHCVVFQQVLPLGGRPGCE